MAVVGLFRDDGVTSVTLPPAVRPWRGYADPAYAASLAAHGRPLTLPARGATVLLVPIEGTPHVEAVTLAAVLDPLRPAPPEALGRFDPVCPFKRHFLTALGNAPHLPSRGIRRSVARARERVEVAVMTGRDADLDDWWTLWSGLVRAAGPAGLQAPSRGAFAQQFALDGALVLVTSDGAHAHLVASNDAGRAVVAMYVLDAVLIETVRGSVTTVHWGGSAGTVDADDGLAAYRRRWTNGVRDAWLVAAVLDRAAYTTLGGSSPPDPDAWFSAWRVPGPDRR